MSHFFSGLDLGQSQDYTALVVTEQSLIPDLERVNHLANHYAVRHIHRWQLGTPYTQVVSELKDWFAAELRDTTLVVDRTGVGRGVCDMIIESGIAAHVQPYSITCGNKPGDGTVPKVDLVGAIQTTLQTRRLQFADELELTDTLQKELETFRVKVTSDRNESYSAWREKDHDDIVLALALAVWYGERFGGSPSYGVTPETPLLPAFMGTISRGLKVPF